MLQHRYRIVHGELEAFLGLIAVVKAWCHELGGASFECWQDEGDPLAVTEVQGYDSWSHYMRLARRPIPPKIKEVYHDIGELIDGGFESVETRSWQPLDIPEWEGS